MLRRLSSKKLKKGQAFLFSTTSLFVWNNENKVNTYPSVTTLNLHNSNNLNEAPFHSPFEGTISLNMSVKEATSNENPTLKGFLTIFQEESGLGAWNRRWCSVQDNKIYYWLYPEDEVNRNKEPHGDIDLRDCKTTKISIASRLDCARPNTFVLVTETDTKPGDRNSIICEASSERTVTKYLLSADSKDERREWMKVLNTCLENVISWNTK